MITSLRNRRGWMAIAVAAALSVELLLAGSPSPGHPAGRIVVPGARIASNPRMQGRAAAPQPTMANREAREVVPVGYLDGCDGSCGPVCDCSPTCGAEPACGFEVGCGVGAALEHLGPACGPDCGPTCGCEASCGVESTFLNEPSCGIGHAGDCGCDACCEVSSIPFCLPLLRINWCRFDFFAGVQAFQGPMNDPADLVPGSGSGSFGFYEGFNEGRSLRRWLGIDLASQFGVRTTQSNLDGEAFTQESRNQVFVTGGLFRRVDYGLQYGTVIDYLNDDWYFQGDLVQIRSETSWKTRGCHVFGFQSMFGLDTDTSTTTTRNPDGSLNFGEIAFEPTDQYRFFYRRLLANAGQWEAFAGFNDSDDGLVGLLGSMPVRHRLAISAGLTYLIPGDGNDFVNESWNLSMGIIYRPGGPNGCGRYCRPLMDVADNGTFLVDRR